MIQNKNYWVIVKTYIGRKEKPMYFNRVSGQFESDLSSSCAYIKEVDATFRRNAFRPICTLEYHLEVKEYSVTSFYSNLVK